LGRSEAQREGLAHVPLVELSIATNGAALPAEVRAFLAEARRRIGRFGTDRVPGFIPSDYREVYLALRAVAAGGLPPGKSFCEWGSGFGVVACLAALLDFDACGIEIEADLVDAARELADDFDLPVRFAHGSFIPPEREADLGPGRRAGSPPPAGGSVRDQLGRGPVDFDVVFTYPWPAEERLVATLFEQHARAGALLVTFHASGDLRLRRKAT
jgi:hypothetical protein